MQVTEAHIEGRMVAALAAPLQVEREGVCFQVLRLPHVLIHTDCPPPPFAYPPVPHRVP